MILAVSLDDVAAQKHFAESQHLSYPVLSDPDGSVATKYGVLAPDGRYARRVTFLVDPQGILRQTDENVDVLHHGQDVVAHLKALQKAAGG